MEALEKLGVQFSLDDFGTGYSSLSLLNRLPLHQLKIDQSFVRGLPDDAVSNNIVKAIVTLGQSLGLEVLAEGVETTAQRDALMAAGCHFFQGHLFGKPAPVVN
jgi:EAL domain-containing protein (putative c-di-GMP-specific phosphodiesterase class I)